MKQKGAENMNELLANRMVKDAQNLVEDILSKEFSREYKDCMIAYVAATLLNKVAEDHYPHQDIYQTLALLLQTVPVTLSSKEVASKNACTRIFLDDVNYGDQLFYQIRKELHYGNQRMSTREVPNLNILCHENNHLLNSSHEELKVTKTRGKKEDVILIRTGLAKLIYVPNQDRMIEENHTLEEVLNETESRKTMRTIETLSRFDIKNLDIKKVVTHEDKQFQSPYQPTITYLRKVLPQIETQAQQARYFGSLNRFAREFENHYQTDFKEFSNLVDQFHGMMGGDEVPIKQKRMNNR